MRPFIGIAILSSVYGVGIGISCINRDQVPAFISRIPGSICFGQGADRFGAEFWKKSKYPDHDIPQTDYDHHNTNGNKIGHIPHVLRYNTKKPSELQEIQAQSHNDMDFVV